ncbi:MAG: hypothetical protein Q9165_006507 [Trypethelium subeluteriae]
MARRLSDNYSVAVIEAGSFYELDNGNLTQIPADASYYLGKDPLYQNPLIDWRQQTTPQYGLEGKPVLYPQGRTLGGGSTRNFMLYQRGTKGSYEKWADEVGDQSFAWSNFLPFFKKSVKFSPPNPGARPANATPLYSTSDYSPTGGPLQVSWSNFANPAGSWLSKGLEAIGLQQIPGMVDGNLLGWTWAALTIEPEMQIRSTSESSFLQEALSANDNLLVYRSTLAKKILFDDNKKAMGVLVENAGLGTGSITYSINATKEVIVSSGTFRSPQILMTSGIGPASTLESQGIEVLADRPGVGQNMWDHVFFGPAYAVNALTHGWLADPAFAAQATAEFAENRTGILTNVGGDLLAFEKLPSSLLSNSTLNALESTFPADWPHIELLNLDAYTGSLNDFLRDAPDVNNYTAICAALVSPFSRGNVTIQSNDTAVHPVVNPNWLTDPRDQEVAIAAFRRTRQVLTANAVKPILNGTESFPGKDVQTDEQILNVIKQSSDTIHHAAGTCRMGRANDTMAVVDSRANVIGVKGVRVVDASAFPFLPPGHPQSTVYALAEKIAVEILNGQ